jgi:alpha-L-arabinofuranosidase
VASLASIQGDVDQITVNPSVTKRIIPPDFFGINYSAFWEPAEGGVASARALAQTPIRLVRFPGGAPADLYNWQDPYYKHMSRTSPLQLWMWARSFGTQHVVFQTNYQGHLPNTRGKSYGVNSPQSAAAWVRYDRAHSRTR